MLKENLFLGASIGIFAGIIIALIMVLINGNSSATIGFGQNSTNYQVLAGTADELVAMPYEASESVSTTTDALSWDAGSAGTINQQIEVNGIEKVALAITGLSGTATSTLFGKFMGSIDGETFFDIVSSTDPSIFSTTTLSGYVKVIQYDFGTATTSKMWVFNIPPIKYLRTVFYGEDLSTDPADGVQAYITLTKLESN